MKKKKLIAVLAVLAMVTTAAYAQMTFEGMVMGRADLGNNFETVHGTGGMPGSGAQLDPDLDGIHARRNFTQEARLFMNMRNHDGTAGATARFWNTGWHAHHGWNNAPPAVHMWAWWRPMENLLVQIGENPWGHFGLNQIVGGAFTGNSSEDSLTGAGTAGAFTYGAVIGGVTNLHRNTGFYGGFIHPGITAAFDPIEGLTVILGLPFAMGNSHGQTPGGGVPANFFVTSEGWVPGMLRSHLSVRYEIADVGRIALTWAGGPGYWGNHDSLGPAAPMVGVDPITAGFQMNNTSLFGLTTGPGRFANSSKFYLSFLLTAIDNIQLNVGGAYTLPFDIDEGNTYNYPVEFGLGFQFDGGDLVFRARLAATFAGSVEQPGGYRNNIPFVLGLNLHPSFNLGIFTAHLNAGIQMIMNMNEDRGDSIFYINDSDMVLGWHATPYITVPVMNATVFAGVHVETSGVQRYGSDGDEMFIRWRVPVGLRFQW